MKDDKKKITALGVARLFAIAGKQKSEGTYEIVEGTQFNVRAETMSVLIGEHVYLTCDEMNICVDEDFGEIIAYLRLKGELIGFCKFGL